MLRDRRLQRDVFLLASSLALLLAGCSRATLVPAPTPTPSAGPDDPFVLNQRLGRGLNLGNALEAPREGEWGVILKEEYFQLIEDAGFDSVRIPVRWSTHAATTAPYTIDPAFFERVDWAVNQALTRKLLVIVNVHHYLEIMEKPQEHRERFLALWAQIAEHYKGYPRELIFELLNEPNGSLGSFTWNEILKEAIAEIRKSNPSRAIVVGPANWYAISSLGTLSLPPEDRHLIASYHYYNPFQFTHQGAEWVADSDPWLGTTWEGTAAEQGAVARELDAAAAWGKANNRPIYMGEFGAYSKADMASRARWTSFVAREAEKRGFSCGYWEFCSGFGAYDPTLRRWNLPLLEALIPPKQ